MNLKATFAVTAMAATLAAGGLAALRSEATEPGGSPIPVTSAYAGELTESRFDWASRGSLSDLLGDSDVVATVTLVRRLPDYWPPRDPKLDVFARFEVRIDESYRGGRAPEQSIVIQVPGGRMARIGNPFPGGGGFEPVDGQESVEVEYAELPYFRVGTVELVFLNLVGSDERGLLVYNVAPDARFVLEPTGRYESVVGKTGSPWRVPKGISDEIVGQRKQDAAKILAAR